MLRFRVHTDMFAHEKVLAAGNPAMGLWVRAGAWCVGQSLSGFVPNAVVPTLGTRGQAQKLVDAGLWTREPDGYRFHDWDAWQPPQPDPDKRRRWLSPDVRRMVMVRDDLVCQLCGNAVATEDVHIDHITPVSRGGTDHLSNLQVTHSACNIAKGARV